MSRITGWVLKRRAATVLIMVVVLLFGAIAVTQLKNELLPNVDFPILTVVTPYPGASAGDVEEQVSKPVEQVVGAVPRLKTIRTVSRESVSFIVAEFEFGTNLKDVSQTIDTSLRNAVLPNDLRGQRVQPNVSQLNINGQAVVLLGLEGKQGQNAQQLSEIARTQVKPALLGINGVANVEVVGDQLRQIKIVPNPQALQGRGLSINDISSSLRGFNVSFPGGTVDVAGQTVPVRTAFTFGSLEDLKNLPVVATVGAGAPAAGGPPPGAGAPGQGQPAQAQPGQPPATTRLSEVADVQEVDAPSNGISRTNGNQGILLQVFKSQSGNTVEVADNSLKKAAELSNQSGGAYAVQMVYDSAGQIRASIDGLVKEGLLGAFFCVLIIFIFLRNVRSTLVTAISIPTSLVVAFILLWTQNISLNIFTLGALAIAVGRVVDDAIVVLENIFRRVQLGEPVAVAAKEGTREVAGAITSSTLTTVAVFLPLGFVGGITGQFFLPFALTATFCLLASLVVALTIIPVFATFFLSRKAVGARKEEERTFIQKAYTPALKWSLGNRWKVLGLSALLFFASNFLVTGLPVAFLPESGDKLLQVGISVAPGTSPDKVLELTKRVEEELGKESRVELRQTTIAGNSSFSRAQQAFGVSSDASILVRVSKSSKLQESAQEFRSKLKPLVPERGNITVTPIGGFNGSAFSLNVQANTSEEVRRASDLVLARLKPISDKGNFVNLRSDVSALNTQVLVTPNPASAGGRINTQTLGFLLAGTLQPALATTVRFSSGLPQEVVVYPPFEPGKNAADLNAFINNLKALPLLGGVPLGAIADVKLVEAPTQATRIGQKPAASVSADITTENTGGVTSEVNKLLANIKSDPNWPVGANWVTAGAGQQQAEAFGGLFIALGIAIALVYIVMVLTFGSLLEPFAILFSLPLASIGAFAALFVTQRAIGLPAMIGLLMLIGIVVTNAIVLIDRVNHNRGIGMDKNAALLEAGNNRVRPILMTAFATILALMPLALGFSEGSIIAAELGTVVIGGLLTSTFLTLLVVPVVYSLLQGAKDRLTRRGKKDDAPTDKDGGTTWQREQATPVVTAAADSGRDALEVEPVNRLEARPEAGNA